MKTSTSTPAPPPNTAWFAPSSMRPSPGPRTATPAIGTTLGHHRLLAARRAPASGQRRTTQRGAVAGGTVGVYYAFIQFAGFTMGKADLAVHRSLEQLSGQQLRRSRRRRRHGHRREPVHLHRSVRQRRVGHDRRAGSDRCTIRPASSTSPRRLRQLGVGRLRRLRHQRLGWHGFLLTSSATCWSIRLGLVQASVAAHDNHAAYYNNGREPGTTSLGHPDDKWGWAGQWPLRSRTSRPDRAT